MSHVTPRRPGIGWPLFPITLSAAITLLMAALAILCPVHSSTVVLGIMCGVALCITVVFIVDHLFYVC
jgi:hypothetical protein